MLVFDGSLSMVEGGADILSLPRIADARIATATVLPEIEAQRRVGLITYGPGSSDGCDGITLHFPPVENAAGPIQEVLDALSPAGLTPFTAAVEEAARTLDYTRERSLIVLVTDGNETCGGRPCATADRLVAQAADMTVHVIGFQFRSDYFAWDNPEQTFGEDTVARCFADKTGGLFVTPNTVGELEDALRATLGCVLIGARDLKNLLPQT